MRDKAAYPLRSLTMATTVTAGLVLLTAAAASAAPTPESPTGGALLTHSACAADVDVEASEMMQAMSVLDRLVLRYQSLVVYEDTTSIKRTTRVKPANAGNEEPEPEDSPGTTDDDADAIDAELFCSITQSGELVIRTSSGEIRKRLGLKVPIRSTPMLQSMKSTFDLWLAPHLLLRFSEDPLRDLAVDGKPPLKPTTVHTVNIDQREMVRLDLTSEERTSDQTTEDDRGEASTSYSLYIDPDSMLVERVEGHQQRADGHVESTTVDITPVYSRTALSPEAAEAFGDAPPQDVPAPPDPLNDPDDETPATLPTPSPSPTPATGTPGEADPQSGDPQTDGPEHDEPQSEEGDPAAGGDDQPPGETPTPAAPPAEQPHQHQHLGGRASGAPVGNL